MPANTEFFANNLGGVGSGPVLFTDGATVSGLSYTFTSLVSTTDNISFSNDNGASYDYTPLPNSNGYDSDVTNIRVSLSGPLNITGGGIHPSFSLRFRVRVQ